MKKYQNLFENSLKSQKKFEIMILGPNPYMRSENDRINKIKNKRLEIKNFLIQEGHNAIFPEDEIDIDAPPPMDNPVLVENFMMTKFDIIINIVETEGTITELGMISLKPEFAKKSLLFICDDKKGDYSYRACEASKLLGADFKEFCYPNDITSCNLLTSVQEMISKLQIARFLL